MKHESVYPASRLKAVLLLLGSLAFVAMGWWLIDKKPLVGWACVVFFSLGVPVSVLMLVPGVMYLRLDQEGFELKSWGRRQKTRWIDVQSFRIASIRGAKMIAIEYRTQYAEQKAARAVAAALSGIEGAIPNSYNIALRQLEHTLNEWLHRFGREPRDPAAPRSTE